MNHTVDLPGIGAVPVSVDDLGAGQPVLLLHGGAGPQSVAGFAALLAGVGPIRVLTPTHPGFNGTSRPDGLTGIADLARLYAQLIADLDLTGVTVVGNSIGGWIAAELALLASPRVSRVVLVDAVGLDLEAYPVVDFFALSLDEIAERSYFDPTGRAIDLDAMTEAQRAVMATNRATLSTYGGTRMADPSLLARVAGIRVPTLVVWGAADRIAPPEHGLAYAAAIPGARWELIDEAGHLPQLETPDRLGRLVIDFAAIPAAPRVSIVDSNGGEVMQLGSTSIRILEDGRTTGHRLGLGEITVAPHTDGPPQHRHGRHDEGFYVVAGTARFTVGDTSYDAPPGTLVMVPPGAPHTFANPGDEPVVLLNTFTPDLYVGYFRELRDLVTGGQPLAPADVTATMARYDTVPATTYAD